MKSIPQSRGGGKYVFTIPLYDRGLYIKNCPAASENVWGSLSMFSIDQQLFLQKSKPLYPNPKELFGIRVCIWDLAIVCP